MSQTHEWHLAEGNLVTVGITQHAADELTDITYVDLPEVGSRVEPSVAFGEIESVKATSELYTAVAGTITEVNSALADRPELVNTDPFGEGWMIKVSVDDLSPLSDLMNPAAYALMIAG
jgi:glycine cleavage system H protein